MNILTTLWVAVLALVHSIDVPVCLPCLKTPVEPIQMAPQRPVETDSDLL